MSIDHALVSLSSSLDNPDHVDDGETELVLHRGQPSQPAKGQLTKAATPPVSLALLSDEDMAPPTFQLPPEVLVVLSHTRSYFKLCCQLDLKAVSCKLRNAEYNPRKDVNKLFIRLFRPAASAHIWHTGAVNCCVKGTEEDARQAARRITRMIQKCGYPARCEKFRLMAQAVVTDLCFPVRIVDQVLNPSFPMGLEEPPPGLEKPPPGLEEPPPGLALPQVEDPSHRAGRGLAAAIFASGKHPCLAMLGFASSDHLLNLGHANDHVCLFLEEERALFTGDNVLGWGTGTFQDLQQYMRSLKLMASQAPEILYPAHGPVVSGTSEAAAWLQMYITHREDRIRQVENELRAVDVGLDLVDLVKRVYKAQPEVLQSEGLFRGACLNTKDRSPALLNQLCASFLRVFHVIVQPMGVTMDENESDPEPERTAGLWRGLFLKGACQKSLFDFWLTEKTTTSVGLLFKICELLTGHGVDICSAIINTSDNGIVYNEFEVRIARPADTVGVMDWCRELEEMLEKTRGPAFDNSLVAVSKRLSVNPDLVSVVTFKEVQASSERELRYHLVLEGINQAGLLTYTALVLFRCGFSILHATISTSEGHIVDTFDLSTKSAEAESLLRSYLDVPNGGGGGSTGKETTPLPFHAIESDPDMQARVQQLLNALDLATIIMRACIAHAFGMSHLMQPQCTPGSQHACVVQRLVFSHEITCTVSSLVDI
ncbi:LACTB2 [Symbiodinium sp. CCMP2592]|nr:LACTB2 [Symbiodinium sp. CCMP2592]